MGAVFDTIESIFNPSAPGKEAASAATEASQTQADYEQKALDYLKEKEATPQQFREEALKQLGGVYGLEGGEGSQQSAIDAAMKSPLYTAIMGGRKEGEEAIMRNAAATGGLRSGNVQANLYDYDTQLANKALLTAYNQRLQGLGALGNLATNPGQIAEMQSQIGQTLGQGKVASAQSLETAEQGTMNNLMGLGKLAIAAFA